MELDWIIGKQIRWVLIQQEYDFHIVHMVGKVNQNVDLLSLNPSSSKEGIIKAQCHGDMDLEVLPKWHMLACLCILLGCSK
jgi:hypothetical protein